MGLALWSRCHTRGDVLPVEDWRTSDFDFDWPVVLGNRTLGPIPTAVKHVEVHVKRVLGNSGRSPQCDDRTVSEWVPIEASNSEEVRHNPTKRGRIRVGWVIPVGGGTTSSASGVQRLRHVAGYVGRHNVPICVVGTRRQLPADGIHDVFVDNRVGWVSVQVINISRNANLRWIRG
jgi:hypothetical protein